MIDVFYVLGAASFFAAMLMYVKGCEALGHAGQPRLAGERES